VSVRARSWGWRHGTRAAWAVRGLDLDVADGERVLLLGPSGAGKSTLLRGLAGLLDPETGDEEGRLELDGVPVRRARSEAVGAGVARTGLLLQDPLSQTVLARCGDDVAFGLENHAVPREEIWPRVHEALAAVGFPYPPERSTARLSGGERQRLALAGVLALRPRLLLLDEPTAMLDPASADGLRGTVGPGAGGDGRRLPARGAPGRTVAAVRRPGGRAGARGRGARGRAARAGVRRRRRAAGRRRRVGARPVPAAPPADGAARAPAAHGRGARRHPPRSGGTRRPRRRPGPGRRDVRRGHGARTGQASPPWPWRWPASPPRRRAA
jgi:energy-coupling factor transporter ATP-binding protein EcfA2